MVSSQIVAKALRNVMASRHLQGNIFPSASYRSVFVLLRLL